MPQELTPFKRAAAELLDTARAARDQEISDRAQIELDRQLSLEEATTPKSLLVSEAASLANRMIWLANHPARPRFLGGSAIKMMPLDLRGRVFAIETPTLLSTEAEQVDNTATSDGYVFNVSFEHDVLRINHNVRDAETQVVKQARSWEIASSKTLLFFDRGAARFERRTEVYGDGFDEWRWNGQKVIIDDYIEQNTWAKKYRISTNRNYPLPGYYFTVEPPQSMAAARGTKGFVTEANELQRLQTELLPRLNPIDGWDFPDSFYTFPYGLIRQAHDQLGRTKSEQGDRITGMRVYLDQANMNFRIGGSC